MFNNQSSESVKLKSLKHQKSLSKIEYLSRKDTSLEDINIEKVIKDKAKFATLELDETPHIEPIVLNTDDHGTSEKNTAMVKSFINESFELAQNPKVAQHFVREQEMKEQKSKLFETIKKMKEDAGLADHFAAEEKEN